MSRELYPYEVEKIKRGKRPLTLSFRNGISLYEIERLCMRQCIRELFLQVIDINILDEEVDHDLSHTNIKSDLGRNLRKTIVRLKSMCEEDRINREKAIEEWQNKKGTSDHKDFSFQRLEKKIKEYVTNQDSCREHIKELSEAHKKYIELTSNQN